MSTLTTNQKVNVWKLWRLDAHWTGKTWHVDTKRAMRDVGLAGGIDPIEVVEKLRSLQVLRNVDPNITEPDVVITGDSLINIYDMDSGEPLLQLRRYVL